MTKKILISLSIIGIVAAIAVGGTIAYFSDTETSTGNTFTAGTIDIAVDRQNPWIKSDTLDVIDMKPSQHEYSEYVIKNVGSNPANVFKRVNIMIENDGYVSEPECFYGNGIWNDIGSPQCEVGGYDSKDDISTVIRYDMSVWVYNEDPTENSEAEPIWWQVIYTDEMGVMLSMVDNQNVLLGMIPSGWYMKVQQSYHMDENTGNWAQGDEMTFDITLTAEQLKGTVYMENKDFADADNPTLVYNDGIKGTMTYIVKDATFNYEFTGRAPNPNTGYSLVFYLEEWSTPSGTGWPRDLIILGSDISDSNGDVFIDGIQDFDKDILNMKVWLVETSHINPSGQLSTWSGNDYLFELGMMDYYDSL